jgi:hypothetical protein
MFWRQLHLTPKACTYGVYRTVHGFANNGKPGIGMFPNDVKDFQQQHKHMALVMMANYLFNKKKCWPTLKKLKSQHRTLSPSSNS